MPIKPEKKFHENRHEKRLSGCSLFLSSPVVRGLSLWKLCGFPLAAFSNSTPDKLAVRSDSEKRA